MLIAFNYFMKLLSSVMLQLHGVKMKQENLSWKHDNNVVFRWSLTVTSAQYCVVLFC